MKKFIFILLLIIASLSFVGCEALGKRIDAPVIELNQKTVTWNSVSGAEKYEVTVGINKYETTECSYEISVTEVGVYQVSVKALDKDQKPSLQSNVLTYEAKASKTPLDTPVLSISGNVITWSVVENASRYEVFYNGVLKDTVETNSYDFKEIKVGTYKISVKAITQSINFTDSELSVIEEIVISEKHIPKNLDAPVITLVGSTVSWEAVNNADRYFIYVNDELVDTTKSLSYDYIDGIYGDYVITVKAVSYNTTSYLPSPMSNSVTRFIPIQEEVLDLTKPVCMFTLNWKAYPVVNENNSILVKGQEIFQVSDYQGISFQFIKDNESGYYRIKMDNGYYLTWKKAPDGDKDLFYQEGLLSKGTDQLFILENIIDGYTYKITAVSNPGYVMCENGVSGYHQYMEMNEGGGYNKGQVWVLHNVNTTIADDVLKKEPTQEPVDLTKPVVIYIKSSSLMPTFNESDLMVKGELYTSTSDYAGYSFELVAIGNYYKIKTPYGLFLEYVKESGSDHFYQKAESSDDAQLFEILNKGNYFIIKPAKNLGYLVCEDDFDGYHLYSDCNVDSQKWIIVNPNKE